MIEWYDKTYFENMWRKEAYRPKNKRYINAIRKYSPKTVLDVGCGNGFLVKKLRERGFSAYGVDFSEFAGKEIPDWFIESEAKKLPFRDKSFDVVISTDFFEHLPEEEIDQVYGEMKRVGHHLIASIGFKPDDQRRDFPIDTHLTVKPKEWWQAKLPEVEII